MKTNPNLDVLLADADKETTHDPWYRALREAIQELPRPIRWIVNSLVVIPGLIVIGIVRAAFSKPGLIAVAVAYLIAKLLQNRGSH